LLLIFFPSAFHKNLCSLLLRGNKHSQINPFKPVVSNRYTSKCSAPYWSNQPFIIFDILALWCSGLSASARVPICQKIKGGLDQYVSERFGRLTFATIRKSVELNGLNFNAEWSWQSDVLYRGFKVIKPFLQWPPICCCYKQ